MSTSQAEAGIVVVGGGVIGLSVAWLAAAAGWPVRLVDPAPGRGASWVAGGMLAPVTEAWPGEEDVLELGAHSLRDWPEFAARLAAEAGDPGLSHEGTLVAAFDRADAGNLDLLAGYLDSQGRRAEPVTGVRARKLVPGLGTSVRSGLLVPGDLAVDNRKLLRALHLAADKRGVGFVRERALEIAPGRVRTEGGTLDCATVVLAAGAWSAGLHPGLAGQVRPLKGEILRLRAGRAGVPPPRRTLRALVEGRPIYLVPRADDELVLGATQYEAGFDHGVTAGGVRRLLEDAERIFPAVSEYELVESAAGVRAASVDNLPFIGELEPGVLAATGHHRGGLLLAPVTAWAVTELLAGRDAGPAAVARPDRNLVPGGNQGGRER